MPLMSHLTVAGVSGIFLIAACSPAPIAPPVLDPVEVPTAQYFEPSDDPIEPEPEPAAYRNRTESGITWTVLQQGTGRDSPTLNDTVKVHYEGWTSHGAAFDSSRQRGQPSSFGVSKVIKGWTEVLQLMVMGDKWRVVIPADLAYGHEAKRPGAPAGDLTFEIELIDIISAPKVPDDVAGPPPSATFTASGLAYRVLKPGLGSIRPTAHDKVKVHYSGWTTDGKMFDSSVARGKPAVFPLSGVIKGWTEGLQLMSEGGVYRIWIPPAMAYGVTPSRPGRPAGMLVFDIELIAVNP
jgi:FKBP-type peptidyl-prolyl cis-trans isomerase